jgi:MAGUK p55 subfamily protein 5
LKPFFVFVSPPRSMDKLRKLIEFINETPISQSELQDIWDEAAALESTYSPYFDLILGMNDLERAYSSLIAEIRSWDKDAQWMPSSWLH